MTHRDTPSIPPRLPDPLLQRLGATLRQYRQQQGFSHRALATRTGIRYSYISQIELGKRNISVLTLLRLTSVLRIPAAWLFAPGAPHTTLPPPPLPADSRPARTTQAAGVTQDDTVAPSPGEAGLLLTHLGATLRASRHQRRLSQQALAASTGLSPTYILEIEQGHRNLSVLSLVRLAEALGLTAADLLAPLDFSLNASPPLTE